MKDLMNHTGASRKAIYLYESKGLLKPNRQENNDYREYDEEDVKRLQFIVCLRELDIPLSLIKKLLDEEDNADILLQGYLEEKKSELSEIAASVSRLDEVVKRMPPNGSAASFCNIAQEIMPSFLKEALHYKIERDYPREYNRRILMNTFEAFLDCSLDTFEKKVIWKEILDDHNQLMNEEILDAYASFYGKYTSEDLELDFQLRRERVMQIAKTAKEDLSKRAEEVLCALRELKDIHKSNLWKEYYQGYVIYMMTTYQNTEMSISYNIAKLTSTMNNYSENFKLIHEIILQKMTDEEKEIAIAHDLIDSIHFDYFDYYNHSYKIIKEKEEADKK